MRSPIPPKVRELLSTDPFMKRCALADMFCDGRIEWHHAFTYAGKRQNEPWCLIPLCHYHHERAGHRSNQGLINDQIRARVAHFKAESDFREKYPRSKLLAWYTLGVSPLLTTQK